MHLVPQSLISKSTSPLSCCPIFSKEYLNPKVRINKVVNQNSVNYCTSPSGLTSRIHPLIFLTTPVGFISLQKVYLVFSQTCIFQHKCRKFSNLQFSAYWKIHLQVKKLNLRIFNHAPLGRSLPQVLIITPQAEGNDSFPPTRLF